MSNLCARCKRNLAVVDEIHVVEGILYCSEKCAVESLTDVVIETAAANAKEIYKDYAEIVTPVDIGIVYEERWTVYSADVDITTIFLTKYLDKERSKLLSTEVIGFYWGEPNERDTELFAGELKAVYRKDME